MNDIFLSIQPDEDYPGFYNPVLTDDDGPFVINTHCETPAEAVDYGRLIIDAHGSISR